MGRPFFEPLWASSFQKALDSCITLPKDPSVLKIVRRENSLRREKNATATAQRYGECSEVLVFLGKIGRKTVRIVKTTAVAKYYGFGRRTIFSTEGSFGLSVMRF